MPENLWSATFFPEPEAAAYVGALVDEGVEVFKVHVQVGAFHLDDPLLDDVWGRLEDSGTPIVVHAGSGPVPNAFTGPEPLARVLARWPRLAVVVAHLGAPEYDEFLSLAERFERVHLDTTMAFTDFFERAGAVPAVAAAAARRPAATRCCWAATSRRSRTRTCTSSSRSRGSASGKNGCGPCVGTTVRDYSE